MGEKDNKKHSKLCKDVWFDKSSRKWYATIICSGVCKFIKEFESEVEAIIKLMEEQQKIFNVKNMNNERLV